SCGPFLSSIEQRDVRQDTGTSPVGAHAFLSAQPLRSGKTLCPLDDRQLSGKLQDVCVQRHFVQSRIAIAGDRVCHAENQRWSGADQAWVAEPASPGKSGSEARLGLCG